MSNDNNIAIPVQLPLDFERWLPILDFEEIFEISNFGRIMRIVDCHRSRAGTLLTGSTDKKGYAHVHLCKDGKVYTRKIHHLVMTAFVGPCPKGYEVNHIDGIKTNNKLSNLEYMTHLDNIRHAYATGLVVSIGDLHPKSKLTSEKVREIRSLLNSGLNTIEIGKLYKVSDETIRMIRSGVTWKHVK